MGLGIPSLIRESSRLKVSALVLSALFVWGPCWLLTWNSPGELWAAMGLGVSSSTHIQQAQDERNGVVCPVCPGAMLAVDMEHTWEVVGCDGAGRLLANSCVQQAQAERSGVIRPVCLGVMLAVDLRLTWGVVGCDGAGRLLVDS